MQTIRLCPTCGSPVPSDSPAGLCPQCLLKSGVPTPPGEGPNSPSSSPPRSGPVCGQKFGDYIIIRLLGQGGMGEVFEAEHIKTGRRLALKVMNQALGSEEDRKRFLREGRLAASVNHPNVVYIYASEEIADAPVIAMELVQCGTLKDQLKHQSFLSPPHAVEAALQIIAGLEAAGNAGVLHRDIKPANCFIDSDGVIKVGDFGLSVSTFARKESLLTATGSMLGTPAYASPEQLRGQPLDVASDIYSTGATLYHLLTGQTPFEGTDFVKLITEVLDTMPVPPNAVRPEIPAGLSRVVMRCLAKDRRARYQNYDELREALLPYRAAEATAAPPTWRFLAGLMDDCLAYGPSFLFLGYWSLNPLDNLVRERTFSSALVWGGFFLWYVLYYAILEGRGGAGVGKLICRLRVVGPDGQAPGFFRALCRVLVYSAPETLPYFILMAFMSAAKVQSALAHSDTLLPDQIWFPLYLLLFVTMRRRNGYAAVQDLLTGTRVVVSPKLQPRPMLATKPDDSTPTATSVEQASSEAGVLSASRKFGPYEITACLWKDGPEELWGAFDPALRRKIWIHVRNASEPPISSTRRDLNRAARLHWLNSGQSDGERWDAYEACEGVPFLAVGPEGRTWSSLRFWLLDLAEELSAALKNKVDAPTLTLDRLWVGANGRALLFDFPCPGLQEADHQPAPLPLASVADMQRFLDLVANVALENSDALLSPTSASKTVAKAAKKPAVAIPLHAQDFLASLARGAFAQPEFIVGNLLSLTFKPAQITQGWRFASLAFVPVILLGFAFLVVAMVNFETFRWQRQWTAQYPGRPSLRAAANVYFEEVNGKRKGGGKDAPLMRVYLTHHFGDLLTNNTFWSSAPVANNFKQNERALLRQAVSESPAPTPRAIQESETLMTRRVRVQQWNITIILFVGMFICGPAAFAFVELLGVVVFGKSPILRLFGMAVVNRQGRPATRWRMLGRWTLVWMPGGMLAIIVAGVAMLGMMMYAGMLSPVTPSDSRLFLRMNEIILPAAAVIFAAALCYAALRPEKTLADRLAGTRLVPM